MTTVRTEASRYRVAGLVVAVPEPVPGLRTVQEAPDLHVRFEPDAPPPGRGVRVFEAAGVAYLYVTENPAGGLRYHFPGYGTFAVAGSTIAVTPEPGIAGHTLWHLLLDQVLPLDLAAAGELVLHSAVVATPGPRPLAILLVGSSGAGKSTTAAAFSAAGASVFSDDFARFDLGGEFPAVFPAGVGVRLWTDAALALAPGVPGAPVAEYGTKVRLPGFGPAGAAPVPLGALLFLADRGPAGRGPRISRVAAGEAYIRAFRQAFRLEVTGLAANSRILDLLARVVDAVPAFEVSFPEGLRGLPVACAEVLRDLGALLEAESEAAAR